MPQFERFMCRGEKKDFLAQHDLLCRRLARFSAGRVTSNTLCTNSNWTASIIERAYDVNPRIIYPPVDTKGFVNRSWDTRENGFITLGRISREKNVLEIIEIIREIRTKGHDVHLHLVGPIPDTSYAMSVRKQVAQNDFVFLEGALPRTELVDFICRHRFGLHGMTQEHYGMAVAELVAAGTIPFVPNGGGQREIVNKNELLLYDTPDEAISKIDNILSNPAQCQRVREELAKSANYFSPGQFQSEFFSLVNNSI
ncbi:MULTISPECIES: glycosyltransferase [Halorussus]|uniref:glycosyltransferase n=1 Tax=Halorussus TaxID=1070314 RepID=UPI0013B35A51|nr:MULTISPECIES: glycosyltransferase [Halorussus]NHN58562.1 glycosyltransferase [Halorussus sp. JP-T4]